MLLGRQVKTATADVTVLQKKAPLAREVIQLFTPLAHIDWTGNSNEQMLFQLIQELVRGMEERQATSRLSNKPDTEVGARPAHTTGSSLLLRSAANITDQRGARYMTENRILSPDKIRKRVLSNRVVGDSGDDDENQDNSNNEHERGDGTDEEDENGPSRMRCQMAKRKRVESLTPGGNGVDKPANPFPANPGSKKARVAQQKLANQGSVLDRFDKTDILHMADLLTGGLSPDEGPPDKYAEKLEQTLKMLGNASNSQLPNRTAGDIFNEDDEAEEDTGHGALVLSQQTAAAFAQEAPMNFMMHLYLRLERLESMGTFQLHLGEVCLYQTMLAQISPPKRGEIIPYNPHQEEESQQAKVGKVKQGLVQYIYASGRSGKGFNRRLDRRLQSGRHWRRLIQKYGVPILYLSHVDLGLTKG